MNREEKKRYLNQYRELKFKIKSLADEHQFWSDQSITIQTSKINQAGVHGGLRKDPDLRYIDKHIKICRLLTQKQEEAEQKLEELLEIIESVPDPIQRSVLTFRYVDGLYFNQIAKRMHYSVQHIWRLHDTALDDLDL